MKNPALFFGAIIVAIICVALGVFFLIPGIPHIIADSNQHIKHGIAFFGVAVLAVLAAIVNRPKAAM